MRQRQWIYQSVGAVALLGLIGCNAGVPVNVATPTVTTPEISDPTTRIVADNPEAILPPLETMQEEMRAAYLASLQPGAPQYWGIWAEEASLCATVATRRLVQIIYINKGKLQDQETSCTHNLPEANLARSISFNGQCFAEGDNFTYQYNISLDPYNTMTVPNTLYPDRPARKLIRCWRPQS